MRSFHLGWVSLALPFSFLSLQFNIINKALLQGDREEGPSSRTKNLAAGVATCCEIHGSNKDEGQGYNVGILRI